MSIGVGVGISAVATRSKGGGWWRAADHLLDGVAPGFFLDVIGQRYAQTSLGPELAVNGNFSNGTTGWDALYQSTISNVGGRLRTTATGTNPYSRQLVPVVVGKAYRVTVTPTAKSSSGALNIYIGNTTATFSPEYWSIGNPTLETQYVRYIVATTNILNIALSGFAFTAGDYYEYDDVSVQEVLTTVGRSAAISDLLTVSNAAPGTYIDSAGVLRQAAANTPRIDWTNGVPELLLEGAATNLFTYSQALTTNWSGGGDGVLTATANFSVAPDGTMSATKLTGTYTSVGRQLYQTKAQINTVMTLSIWMRANSGTITVELGVNDFTNAAGSGLQSVTVTTQWQRFTLTVSVGPSLAGSGRCGIRPKQSLDDTQYLLAWGAQLEAGAAATSLIPTTSSAATRTTDVCTLTASAAAVLQGAGAAVACRGSLSSIVSGQRLIGLPTGQPLLRSSSATSIVFSGAASSLQDSQAVVPGPINVAIGWGASGRIMSVNGAVSLADTVTLTYSLSSIFIGDSSGIYAGQTLRLRQMVGWSLPDRPSALGVQAQARAA